MRILFFFGVIFLSGCANLTYHPKEYTLNENRINNFNVSGPVKVENAPVTDDSMKIFDDIVIWNVNREELNSALTAQLQKEINRHGIVKGQKAKLLQVKINSYQATQPGFTFKVENQFTITGSDGFKKEFKVTDTTNGSLGGDILRSFNSALAVSVINVLKDPDVLAYLER